MRYSSWLLDIEKRWENFKRVKERKIREERGILTSNNLHLSKIIRVGEKTCDDKLRNTTSKYQHIRWGRRRAKKKKKEWEKDWKKMVDVAQWEEGLEKKKKLLTWHRLEKFITKSTIIYCI